MSQTTTPTENAAPTFTPPNTPSRRSLAVIIGVVVLFNVPLIHYFVFRGQTKATVTLPFHDDFSDRTTVERNYWSTGGLWRVDDGALMSPGVKNNPLWLKASLPNDAVVEFDAKSMSPEGDIKCEIFGDGSDHASGYVLIMGGWNNQISIIARLDEHGPDASTVNRNDWRDDTRVRVERRGVRAEPGRWYHWKIQRVGATIVWSIDGQEFLRFDDPKPLTGKGHDRFAFSSWDAQLYFDNLSVQ